MNTYFKNMHFIIYNKIMVTLFLSDLTFSTQKYTKMYSKGFFSRLNHVCAIVIKLFCFCCSLIIFIFPGCIVILFLFELLFTLYRTSFFLGLLTIVRSWERKFMGDQLEDNFGKGLRKAQKITRITMMLTDKQAPDAGATPLFKSKIREGAALACCAEKDNLQNYHSHAEIHPHLAQ